MRKSARLGLLVAIALTACTQQQQNASQAGAQRVYSSAPRAVKNAYLTAAVAARLSQIDIDAATKVRISANDGVITLSGQARSAGERTRYADAAASVDNVSSVRDRLSVDPHLRGLREETGAATLEARVSTAIAAEAGLNVFHVTPTVQGGVVTLNGSVPSRSVESTIVQTVRNVKGVKTVIDRVTVQRQ